MKVQVLSLCLLVMSTCPMEKSGVKVRVKKTVTDDGKILSCVPVVLDLFDNLSMGDKEYFGKRKYEELVKQFYGINDVKFFKIVYKSDGLKITGCIAQPEKLNSPTNENRVPKGSEYPYVIYNRGGAANFGPLLVDRFLDMYPLAQKGYIVLASNYRGGGGSEGKDEFGGKDVNDVLNLVKIAKDLSYIDKKNAYMFGVSRGGIQTCLVNRAGIKLNAAVCKGTPFDGFMNSGNRPAMGWYFVNLLQNGHAGNPDEKKIKEEMVKRSPIKWAKQISVPLLILQGGKDWRVHLKQSMKFALKLEKLGKKYKLVIYSGDDHPITTNREDVYNQIFSWFEQHRVT